jgi:hypothetical protein
MPGRAAERLDHRPGPVDRAEVVHESGGGAEGGAAAKRLAAEITRAAAPAGHRDEERHDGHERDHGVAVARERQREQRAGEEG